ncbi:MAG: bifunctional diaminohydroxyphosphoribosylaminopyrimidine deaminase/5-amino-6-(5-phosphoribosylamino)uracil reductase RibD [Bacteroidota bacterium]
MNTAEQFMSRCIELASNGLGNVAPNPMVGCVVVHEGKIIGEGFHKEFGKAHAEVNAINDVIEKHGAEILTQSELFVSLEPCTHFGKTPPCADLIIAKKIPKVFIGCMDTFSEVNGLGIKKLNASGIQLTTGILEQECRELNKRFFTFHEKKRPYIILKWAQSKDQFIAPKTITEENRWISNEHSRRLTHKWRSEEQAIMVGSNTVTTDNPGLTVRDWKGKNPLRIVIDPLNTIDNDARVLDQSAPALIFNETKNLQKGNTEWKAVDFSKNSLKAILQELYNRNIQSVIVEGGAFTLRNFIEQNLWDEARIFIANKFLDDGVKAPAFNFTQKKTEEIILDDQLYFFRNN